MHVNLLSIPSQKLQNDINIYIYIWFTHRKTLSTENFLKALYAQQLWLNIRPEVSRGVVFSVKNSNLPLSG